MLKIHKEFLGGNIHVARIEDDTVYLENELRDTEGDWFYWAFCVEGAAGRTLTFRFGPNRVGYFGPAVSSDLKSWHWLGQCEGESFTYTFAPDEDKVYFAHNMLYHPARFTAFAAKHGWEIHTLCTSRRGRSVPCISFGSGEKKILLMSRHHACESTGDYVLEGVLDRLAECLPEGFSVFCVPFVDYDGVVDGDQGKNRAPHDHNRDYSFDEDAVHPSCAALRQYVDTENVVLAFDFHSPWHKGGCNDKCFIVQNFRLLDNLNRFAELFQDAMKPDAFQYRRENDYPPGTGWNAGGSSTSTTSISRVLRRGTADLAFSLETAYFGEEGNVFSDEGAVETGRCFTDALLAYIKERGL